MNVVPVSEERWSLPTGAAGSRENPIVLDQVDAVSLKIGDRVNPNWGIGSSSVNGANPQTTFPIREALGVFCVGCNGPRPSISILHWKRLSMNRRATMVARVSLGVDATNPKTVYNDFNSIMIEVWFKRGVEVHNRIPRVEAGPDQVVRGKQSVTLVGEASDPDGDALVIAWTQTSGPKVNLTKIGKTGASFVAPDVSRDTTLRFTLTVEDEKGGVATDQVQVTVKDNHPPEVSPPADQRVSSGTVVELTAVASDPDGDPLTYLWSQTSGPPGQILQADQRTANLTTPIVDTEAEMELELHVSDGHFPVVKSFRIWVEPGHPNSIILPAGVKTSHPRFENTFVGVTVVNPNPHANQVSFYGRDSNGTELLDTPLDQSLAAQGQRAFLTQEIVGSATETVALLARGHSGPIQTLFMVGDFDSRRLDGIGGALDKSRLLYFPLARHQGSLETTLIFVFNDGEEGDPAVALRLYQSDGTLDRETSLSITAFGVITGTLGEIFGEPLEISDGYLEVESEQLLSGVEFLAREETFSAMAAQLGTEARFFRVPHLFVDEYGGDTEIRLLNVGEEKTLVEIWAFDDSSNELGQAEVIVMPKEMFVGGARGLLALDPSEANPVITGHLMLKTSAGKLGRYWIQRPGTLVGTVSFSGNGGQFRSTLPLVSEGRKETLLLHVAQSQALRMFTGVSILNPQTRPAQVTVQAYSENGEATAERTLLLEPDHRVVDILDGDGFFGPGFEQVGGHLKILSDLPVVVFALFGDFDSHFLSAIEGQAPVE